MVRSWTGALVAAAALATSFAATAQTATPDAAPATLPAPAESPAPAPVRPSLSAEDVSKAFTEGVRLCAKAAFRKQSVGQLPAPDRALVGEADPTMREFAQAPEGRPAFNVLSASGIVIISEREPGSCEVFAYGPRVRPTFARAAQALLALQMSYAETDNGETASEIYRTYERVAATGEKVTVQFVGGEPGMEGRDFRYPLLNVYFTRSGGAQQQ